MEEKEQQLYKQWWFWGMLLLVIGIIGWSIYANSNTVINNYKRQAILILTDYKSSKITKNEASQKIDALEEKTYKEYEERKNDINSNENEVTKVLGLSIKLSGIEMKLSKGELSNSEIDKYIEEIKDL